MRRWWLLLLLAVPGSGGLAQPSPPSQWMVFFDWGKVEIRRDDAVLLDRIAQEWRGAPSSFIRLSGHSDRSGGRDANRASALMRARAVSAELQRRGVPADAIRLESHGEDQPLVPTEDGVREVQNRRVEIGWVLPQ